VPSGSLYPHQWSWDSAFVAFGLQHWAPGRAAAELLSLFGGQWSDGRVPHIVFNPAVHEHAYFPGPAFWRSTNGSGRPLVATSGIIQPPVHASAALAVLDHLPDASAFAARIYPLLKAQNDYIAQRRIDPETGLAFILHPWESGLDNCPSWDAPLAAVPVDLSLFERFTRRDLDHAGEHERPTDGDYARYIRLALAYRDHGYDDAWAHDEAEFAVVDPVFNTLWAASERALAKIAERLRLDPVRHLESAARITTALQDRLWPAGAKLAQAYDMRSGILQPEATVGGALPLLLPDLDREIVERIVRALTGSGFEVGSSATLGVPSYDRTSAKYDPTRYWRGPSWMNTTWLVTTGLRRHSYLELVCGVGNDQQDVDDRLGREPRHRGRSNMFDLDCPRAECGPNPFLLAGEMCCPFWISLGQGDRSVGGYRRDQKLRLTTRVGGWLIHLYLLAISIGRRARPGRLAVGKLTLVSHHE
jgi:Mannosylglycerate hydrolase MGH1-like glycoside hydrolase domain